MRYEHFNEQAYIRSIDGVRLQDIRRAKLTAGEPSRFGIIRRLLRRSVNTVTPSGWEWR